MELELGKLKKQLVALTLGQGQTSTILVEKEKRKKGGLRLLFVSYLAC
jgi:hypothetical protein